MNRLKQATCLECGPTRWATIRRIFRPPLYVPCGHGATRRERFKLFFKRMVTHERMDESR